MIITDAVAQPLKVQSLAIEPGQSVYSLRLNPPDARSLGLREGQVVNTVSENRPEGHGLRLTDNSFLRVNSTPPIPPGTQVEVRIISLSQGIISILVKQSKESENQVTANGSKLDRLMSRSSNPSSLEFLLRKVLSSADSSPLPGQLSALALDPKWFEAFNHRSIFSSLLASGLFHEKQVLQRAHIPNLKEILLRLLRGQNLDAAETLMIGGAVEDIESNQLESLGHQVSRGIFYQWLIPVLGEWPVRVQIFTEGEAETNKERESDEYLWRVSLEIKVDEVRSIDVSLLVAQSVDLDIFVFVPSKSMFDIATDRADWLGTALSDAGLKAREIKIYEKRSDERANPYLSDASVTTNKRIQIDA